VPHVDNPIFVFYFFTCVYFTKSGFINFYSKVLNVSCLEPVGPNSSKPPIISYLVAGISSIYRCSILLSPLWMSSISISPVRLANDLRKVAPTIVVNITTMREIVTI